MLLARKGGAIAVRLVDLPDSGAKVCDLTARTVQQNLRPPEAMTEGS